MPPETATRLQHLDLMARQISAQISCARRTPDPPSPSQTRMRLSDRRSRTAEEYDLALRRGLEEIENLLRARTEELQGERLRSREEERRSRSLLTEARDQLAVAERRADEAEEYLCALHKLIRDNLDFGRTHEAALTRP